MIPPHVWGASAEEVAAAYPSDALGFAHEHTYFRAVTVDAPRPLVFRWLCQLRAAPYSYDWLDNFGRRSPDQLTPGLENLARGQRIMHIFRLVDFVPDESLTVALAQRGAASAMGDFAGCYKVNDAGGGSRLIAKVMARYPAGPYGSVLRRVMPSADLFMFKRQLETLKAYAERDARGPAYASSVA